MSFFTQLTQVVHIDKQNTITLRCLTYGEEATIRQRHMTTSATQSGGGTASVDAVAMERDTFKLAIVSWDGPGFENKPVTPETIEALPSWIVDLLKEPYNELSTIPDVEKKE